MFLLCHEIRFIIGWSCVVSTSRNEAYFLNISRRYAVSPQVRGDLKVRWMSYLSAVRIHGIFWRRWLVCKTLKVFMWVARKQFLSVCERSNYEASMLISAFLQVWVVESSMEVVARQLLLLYLALMPQESMGNNGVWDLVYRLTYMNTSNRKYQWS